MVWEGDSIKALCRFPDDVKRDLGFQIYKLQLGDRPDDFKSMTSSGPGVYELRESDDRTWYRVIYFSKVADTLYILHCFEKKTRKTSKPDIETAKLRLKRVRARLAEEKKMKPNIVQDEKPSSPSHVTTGNIFEDLGFNKTESAALRIKADLLSSIQKIAKARGYKQRDLEKILDQPQPRISELLLGKISRMSIDKLVDYLHRLGAETKVNVTVRKTKKRVT